MDQTTQSWWFIFYKDQLLLEKKGDGKYAVPCGESSPIIIKEKTTVHNITTLEGRNCKAFSLSSPFEESEQWAMIGLRASYDYLPLSHYQTAGKAHEILHWDRNSRFCSACGTPDGTERVYHETLSEMWSGGISFHIHSDSCISEKKDSLLLVHARNFKGTFNSLVAGFLETGETLEECVAREVKEETGLDVKNITYFGNQPWPYPSGLMVGFIADYAGGEITLQDEELSSGDFYTRDHLPELPRKLSLARKMIDWWIEHPNEHVAN
ncbi:NAD(+) diphosphatase [Candidatus Bacteroides intestinigallinarum]|nr:NAD(+) diphosphatase [Candidatus Bacteroides intestinigallinarum]MCS3199670.1 NAD(+) diphosphatase [Candidatus Bacteroides intestinigallinarum]